MGWGGVGMLTFVWSWTRHWCYAEHGVGWGCERSFEVEHAIDATLSMGWGGVGMLTFGWSWTRHWCYAEHGVGWGCERENALCPDLLKKQHRSTCTMITETGKAKKGPDFVWKGCQTQEKCHFLKHIFTLRRLRNTERVVIFWPWWCAYTRDSAPGG